ncbi:hypothetical protein AAG570_003410 [Ranatra chinensis]|uniref:Uncharacterized protein n=1 Tax=Ranatra chinensis TaxID=642074 RepID=A0ABD0YQB5_9HEMI
MKKFGLLAVLWLPIAASLVFSDGAYQKLTISIDSKVPTDNCRTLLANLEVRRCAEFSPYSRTYFGFQYSRVDLQLFWRSFYPRNLEEAFDFPVDSENVGCLESR